MFRSLLFSSFLFLIACGGAAEKGDAKRQGKASLQTSGPAMITGTITNPRVAFVQMRTTGQSFRARVEKDGSFELPLSPTAPTYYDLLNGNQAIPVYVKPGDQLSINFDGKNPRGTMTFSGTGSIENNYLQLKQKDLAREMRANQQNYGLPEADFVALMNQNLQKATNHIEEYTKSNPTIDEQFVALQKADARYLWADEHFNYPKYHVFYGKNPSYQPSASFNAFKEQTDLNDDQLIASASYQKFLIHYLYEKANEMMKADPSLETKQNALTLANLKTVKDEFTAQKVKDYLTFSVFQDHLKYQSVNDLKVLMEEFNKSNTNPIYKQIINAEYNKWIHLNRGMPAPIFAYKDINGKEVSLEDLKGKFVYIDIWATWCGPCKKEIPFLEELQKEFKNHPKVAFVSVSIDKDVAAWRKMVKDKNLKGIQLIGDNAGNSKISQDYKVSGIPRFILVDDQGKIVDVKAPRPSSKQIKTILDDLIKTS